MMPLTLANMGEENLIHRVGGSPEVKSIWRTWALWPGAPSRWWRPWAETSS